MINSFANTQVGSEDGFIPEGTYYSMARNGQLIVLRRGIPGCPALVDFETMRKDVKKEYIVRKGDPRAEIAAKTQKSILEDAIVYSNAAYEFFSVKYRYDGDKKLPPAKIDEYTLIVRIYVSKPSSSLVGYEEKYHVRSGLSVSAGHCSIYKVSPKR